MASGSSTIVDIATKSFPLELMTNSFLAPGLNGDQGEGLKQSFSFGCSASYKVQEQTDEVSGETIYKVLCKLTSRADVPPEMNVQNKTVMGAYPFKLEVSLHPSVGEGAAITKNKYTPMTLNGSVSETYQTIAEKNSQISSEHSQTHGKEVSMSLGLGPEGPSASISGSLTSSTTDGGSVSKGESAQLWDSADFSIRDWECNGILDEVTKKDQNAQHWQWTQRYPWDASKLDPQQYKNWPKNIAKFLFNSKLTKVKSPSPLSAYGVEFPAMVLWTVTPNDAEAVIKVDLLLRCYYVVFCAKGVNSSEPNQPAVFTQVLTQRLTNRVQLDDTGLEPLKKGEFYTAIIQFNEVIVENKDSAVVDNVLYIKLNRFESKKAWRYYKTTEQGVITIRFRTEAPAKALFKLLVSQPDDRARVDVDVNGNTIHKNIKIDSDTHSFDLGFQYIDVGLNTITVSFVGECKINGFQLKLSPPVILSQ